MEFFIFVDAAVAVQFERFELRRGGKISRNPLEMTAKPAQLSSRTLREYSG